MNHSIEIWTVVLISTVFITMGMFISGLTFAMINDTRKQLGYSFIEKGHKIYKGVGIFTFINICLCFASIIIFIIIN